MLLRPSRAGRGDRPNGPFAINRESPQAQGLVGWWPIANGEMPRDYARAHHATLGAGTHTPKGMPFLGQATYFDSLTYYAIPDAADLTQPAGFSVAFWGHYLTAGGNDGWMGRYTPSGLEWILGTFSAGTILYFLVYDASVAGYVSRTSSTGLATMRSTGMHSAVLTYSGGTAASSLKIFVDGRQVDDADGIASGTFVQVRDTATELQIGQAPSWDSAKFVGEMADVRFYARELKPSEVWQLYDPATRWDLYWQPSSRVFFDIGGAAAPSDTQEWRGCFPVSRPNTSTPTVMY